MRKNTSKTPRKVVEVIKPVEPSEDSQPTKPIEVKKTKDLSKRSLAVKKAWHTRKVNKRYKEYQDKISADKIILDKLQNFVLKEDDLLKDALFLEQKQNQFIILSEKLKNKPDIINQLPIESYRDFSEIELFGKSSKVKFKDVVNGNKLVRELNKLSEDYSDKFSELRVVNIELLEEKIKSLESILDTLED